MNSQSHIDQLSHQQALQTSELGEPKPVCVDCDGTLIRSDLMHESLVRLVLRKPWLIPAVAYWLVQGRQVLKQRLAEHTTIDATVLPYREEVLHYIKDQRAGGAELYLVTAASGPHARQVAEHLNIFKGVFHSDEQRNLKGKAKADLLVENFGSGAFHYVGDSKADLPVWKVADKAVVAGGNPHLLSKVGHINPRAINIPIPVIQPINWLKLMRIHQWAKNFIIFIPLLISHKIFEAGRVSYSIMAFLALGLVASSTYIINDLSDLDNDRNHRTKRKRPLASGQISIVSGACFAALLLFTGMMMPVYLPGKVLEYMGMYIVTTLSYSLYMKKAVIMDAILLAGLYTIRLLIGHIATAIPISIWLLAFSIFLFFSLALVKRFVELGYAEKYTDPSQPLKGRGYMFGDQLLVAVLGVSSGMLSVLVLILYVNSPDVKVLYTSPLMLILLAPILLYWIARVWLLAARGQLNEDPVLFAIRDKYSYALAVAVVFILVFLAGAK